MKIKTRILGIGLVLMLVASVVAMAIPSVSAGPPGDTQWLEQSKPGIPAYPIYSGSEGTDFAQSPSTGRVFIVDRVKDKIKTGTTGTVWSSLNNYASAGTAKPNFVAVAPDNDSAIAVAELPGNSIQISNDRGVNWSTLPTLPAAAGNITDIAVGPARTGTLLGREYVVTVANALAANTTHGGIYILGGTASWAAVATTAGAADFTQVEFSPGYLGDRVLVATGVTAANLTQYWLLNTATDAALTGYPATVRTGVGAGAGDVGAAIEQRVQFSLPTDFDPTSSPVSYVSIGNDTATSTVDDAYRMNSTVARDLGLDTSLDSIGYGGTQSEGTLFVGYTTAGGAVNAAKVKRTANPTATAPTWVSSRNNPTGSTYVMVRPNYDFASSNRVNAFTRGSESAWSISDDGGVSFYQRSWIDNGSGNSDWVAVEDMAITSDGSQVWFITDDGALTPTGLNSTLNKTYMRQSDLHIWASPLPPSSMSQKRMYTIPGVGDGTGWSNASATTGPNSGWNAITGNWSVSLASATANLSKILLNPDWAASPTIIVVQPGANPDAIYVSNNGGATWATRIAPANDIDTLVMVDKDTLYATKSNNFYKTTNQCWTWEPAVAWTTSATTAQNMVVTDDGTIFISSSSVRKSSNGGASWASVGSYNNPTGSEIVLPDANYADNGIVYIAGTGNSAVSRLDVATDTWRGLGNPATGANGTIGLVQVDGALYAISSHSVERNHAPTVSLTGATASWSNLNVGVANPWAGTVRTWANDGSTFYVAGGANGAEDLWGYSDTTVGAKPVISTPASGIEIAVDTVGGRGVPFTIVVDSLGEAQGKIDRWDWKIYDKAAGAATATTNAAQAGSSKISTVLGAPWNAMLPNTTYVFMVRGARTASGQLIKTAWSDPVEVTVQAGTQVTQTYAGPQILGPQGGGTTGLNPGFAWAPVSGATKYQFIVATDASLTKTIGGTPVEVSTPSYQVTGLDYGTTYFWAVKVLEPTPGTQTISTFATMDEPAAPVGGGGTAPPVVEVPTQPVPDVIVNVPPQGDGGSPISTTAIWAVIGIGAVLIVAVLVLIVRTRRPV
jgi:hypothetical protein